MSLLLTRRGEPTHLVKIPYRPRKWAVPFHRSFLRFFVLLLHRRAGKAQPLSANVLTPSGFVPMGKLCVGSEVLAPDGTVARVRGIFPQGVQPVFRVTMADGSSTRATGDHLWKVSYANRRRKDQIATTDELRAFLAREATKSRKIRSRPLLDMISPEVEFGSTEPLPLDPYILGVLLGDGGFSSGMSIRMTTADAETVEAFRSAGLDIRSVGNAYDYRINGLYRTIESLGLTGKKSHNKFVPEAYLRASRSTRLAVLQGLLDTDGSSARDQRSSIEFCSVSLQLAKDVAFLSRSLGWRARVSAASIPSYTYAGKKLAGQPRYRVGIRAGSGGSPFRLARKRATNCEYRFSLNRNAIVSIEPDGEEACQCIQVDHPSQLYVTDDFIVTHNTTSVINHHIRAATDNNWERQRLLSLMPNLSENDLKHLMRGRNYGHIMPTYKQAKKVAWDMLKYYSANIPGAIPNESDLSIKFTITGATVALYGADNPDSLRGPAFSGISYDEFSQQDPVIHSEVISKALADHLGYAIWAGTLKGQDHLYARYQGGVNDPDFYTVWQDIDTSLRNEDGPTIAMLQRALADDRKDIAKGLMTQDEFDQEWFLSIDAAIQGAYYRKQLAAVKKENRITRIPYDPNLPVDTDWDLGVDDHTSIWFSQSLRTGEIRLIDFYEHEGEGMPHYAQKLRELQQERGYTYGEHWAPHDIAVTEWGTGKSRKETAAAHGIYFNAVPKLGLADGINAARLVLPRCWFDEDRTKVGVNALRHYRKKWNETMKQFGSEPVHDAFSHAADAFRYLAVRHQLPKMQKKADETKSSNPYDTRRHGQSRSWMST